MNEEIESILHREGFVLANVSKRAIAFFIDDILLSFLLIIALYDNFNTTQNLEELIQVINQFLLEYIMMKIAYQTFFVKEYGATIGKIAMKIKVIEIQTLDNPSLLSSFNRAIFRVISEIFYLGFLWGIMDPFLQTWHDKTAKTLVIDV